MAISVEAAKAAAGNVLDPELQRPLVDAGMLGDVQVDGSVVSITITLTTPAVSAERTHPK
jgi:metal-sulfur cluster biosynthetic enzyme